MGSLDIVSESKQNVNPFFKPKVKPQCFYLIWPLVPRDDAARVKVSTGGQVLRRPPSRRGRRQVEQPRVAILRALSWMEQVQGDPSGCSLAFVDIKTKVAF